MRSPRPRFCLRGLARLIVGTGLAVGLFLPVPGVRPASADTKLADLQIIARSMGFLQPAPEGPVEVGIVYPAGSAEGQRQAEQLAAEFGSEVRVGRLILRPKLITADGLAKTDVPVLLLTEAVLAQAGGIAAEVAGRHILIVAPNADPVEAGLAVLAVQSQPRVQIYVSRAAARNAGIVFAPAFRMMIQER